MTKWSHDIHLSCFKAGQNEPQTTNVFLIGRDHKWVKLNILRVREILDFPTLSNLPLLWQ